MSIVIFTIGGIFSVLRGVEQIRHPHPLGHLAWNYAVLLTAFLFEGFSAIVATKELKKLDPKKTMWKLIRDCKHPALITIFLQDTASLVGITIAALGMGLAWITEL